METKTFDVEHMFLKHPFCMTIAGPSQSGKTRFVMTILEKKLIRPLPSKIYYCYAEWQSNFDVLKILDPNINFIEGVANFDNLDSNETNLIILDDLMAECCDNKDILDLFTKGSHHKNTSVIYLSQNVFCKGKYTRSLNLNSQYLVLFKNPRDKAQISYLARQLFPKKSKDFENAFEDAVNTPYGYMLVDLKQDTPEELRVRTCVNDCIYVYII